MNSFNTHDDTQKVPFSFYFCLQKFDDLLAFVADMLSITFSFFWRLLRSMPTPTLRFTLSIRFTVCFCYTSTSSIFNYVALFAWQAVSADIFAFSSAEPVSSHWYWRLLATSNQEIWEGWLVSFFVKLLQSRNILLVTIKRNQTFLDG